MHALSFVPGSWSSFSWRHLDNIIAVIVVVFVVVDGLSQNFAHRCRWNDIDECHRIAAAVARLWNEFDIGFGLRCRLGARCGLWSDIGGCGGLCITCCWWFRSVSIFLGLCKMVFLWANTIDMWICRVGYEPLMLFKNAIARFLRSICNCFSFDRMPSFSLAICAKRSRTLSSANKNAK